jgi:hypothetical protein
MRLAEASGVDQRETVEALRGVTAATASFLDHRAKAELDRLLMALDAA